MKLNSKAAGMGYPYNMAIDAKILTARSFGDFSVDATKAESMLNQDTVKSFWELAESGGAAGALKAVYDLNGARADGNSMRQAARELDMNGENTYQTLRISLTAIERENALGMTQDIASTQVIEIMYDVQRGVLPANAAMLLQADIFAAAKPEDLEKLSEGVYEKCGVPIIPPDANPAPLAPDTPDAPPVPDAPQPAAPDDVNVPEIDGETIIPNGQLDIVGSCIMPLDSETVSKAADFLDIYPDDIEYARSYTIAVGKGEQTGADYKADAIGLVVNEDGEMVEKAAVSPQNSGASWNDVAPNLTARIETLVKNDVMDAYEAQRSSRDMTD